MSYIDWEYYNSRFPQVTQEQFKRLLPVAETKIEVYTHFRCLDVKGYKADQVKAAVANLVNAMADHKTVSAGSGVTSVSNAGYSESYANITKEQAEEELKNVCFQWLSGTGLMGAL